MGQSCPGCTNAASWLMAGWHLDGARAKSRGGGRAENSSPKSVLQQSCCPFLVEVDFKVSVVVVFLPLHTLFSVSFPTATLKFSSLYIYLPKKPGSNRQVIAFCALLLISSHGWVTVGDESWLAGLQFSKQCTDTSVELLKVTDPNAGFGL